MSDGWDEFNDADVHIVELIRSAKSARCVEVDRKLFFDYSNEVSDFANFAFCGDDDLA